jgi:hypothetical protein
MAAPGYVEELQERASRCGMKHPLREHRTAPPSEMARLAAPFDLGLSLELPPPLNRDINLSNKIFVYVLAGIPQFLSRTTAQSAIAARLGAAAIVGDIRSPKDPARELDAFFSDPARIAAARATAWRLGRETFCWDIEKESFLAIVRPHVSPPRTVSLPAPKP